MAPTWPQHGLKDNPDMAQHGPSMAQQDGANMAQDGHKISQMAPGRPKMAPTWPQGGPKKAQRRPKVAQDGPKMAPRRPPMAPRRPQHGPKRAPRDFTIIEIAEDRRIYNKAHKALYFAVFCGLQRLQDSCRMAPTWPNMGPRCFKIDQISESLSRDHQMFRNFEL